MSIRSIFSKQMTLFGRKYRIVMLGLFVLFVLLMLQNIVYFTIALFELNYYTSLLQFILFCWNSGLLYYNILADRLQNDIETGKI